MNWCDGVFYFGMWILSVALAGICVFQITKGDASYAGAAAVGFVITFSFAIDGMLFHYFSQLAGNFESILRIIQNKEDKKPQ